MRYLGSVPLFAALVPWGTGEALGRHAANLPQNILQAISAGDAHAAVTWCLASRAPVVAGMLQAHVLDVVLVELDKTDLPRLFVMGMAGQPRTGVEADARSRAAGNDPDNAWARQQMAGNTPAAGPLFGVARSAASDITLVDGMHRAAVWAMHGDRGLDYPMEANVAITAMPTIYEGIPRP